MHVNRNPGPSLPIAGESTLPHHSPLGWDADGVVIDSRSAAWEAIEDIVGLFGHRPSVQAAADKIRIFDRAAQIKLAGEDGAPTLRAMHRILMRARSHTLGVFDEVLDIVGRLERRPRLITAAYATGVHRALGHRAALFDSIEGREFGPKNELIAAASTSGLEWFVTDTLQDLRRCRAYGVKVLAVGWGYDPLTDLVAAGADLVASTPTDLAATLMQLGFLNSKTVSGEEP